MMLMGMCAALSPDVVITTFDMDQELTKLRMAYADYQKQCEMLYLFHQLSIQQTHTPIIRSNVRCCTCTQLNLLHPSTPTLQFSVTGSLVSHQVRMHWLLHGQAHKHCLLQYGRQCRADALPLYGQLHSGS
jgi:hypothetical protein